MLLLPFGSHSPSPATEIMMSFSARRFYLHCYSTRVEHLLTQSRVTGRPMRGGGLVVRHDKFPQEMPFSGHHLYQFGTSTHVEKGTSASLPFLQRVSSPEGTDTQR